MNKSFNLTNTLMGQLRVTADSWELSSPRNSRILSHYQEQIDRSRMDHITATERCIGDMCGANRKPDRTQRGTIRT